MNADNNINGGYNCKISTGGRKYSAHSALYVFVRFRMEIDGDALHNMHGKRARASSRKMNVKRQLRNAIRRMLMLLFYSKW